MHHVRFELAFVAIEQIPIVLRSAQLLVVEREGADRLDWECVAHALEATDLPRGRHRVDLTTVDGRLLSGWAVLVRSHEGVHVLRGDGVLDGIDPGELSGSGSAD
jgi:hypothetical protein